MVKVAPSLLSADFSILEKELQLIEKTAAEWLHFDIMDGHFVPNLTFGPLIVSSLRPKTNLFFDVHLMVEKPDFYIKPFAQAGAQLLTVHQEACTHLHRIVHAIKEEGLKAGVSLNPATPPQFLDYLLEDLDLVLVMSVNPGFPSQSFLPAVLPKIRYFSEKKKENGLSYEIQVDGGINEKTAPLVIQAGATVLVTGSAFFKHVSPGKYVEALKLFSIEKKKV